MKRQRQGGWLKPLRLMRLSLEQFGKGRPFAPTEHFLHLSNGITTPAVSTLGSKRFWVLSRACFAVRIIELKEVPVDKRSAALSLAAAAWTPFAATSHYIIMQTHSALLCAWDRDFVSNAQTQIDVEAADVTVIPEVALRSSAFMETSAPNSADTKVALTQALEGIVATVGNRNGTSAEQWWPSAPPVASWLNFQRSVGVHADQRTDVSDVKPASWLHAPIGYALGQTENTTSMRERWMLAIAAWLLLIPTLWFGNEWRQLNQLKNTAERNLIATERELDSTLGARGQAIAGLDRVGKIANLFNQPDNLALFNLVNNVLAQISPSGTLQLVEWDLRGSQLKFVLNAPNGNGPTATTLVKAFEKAQSLRDVEVNVDGARTVVSVRVIDKVAENIEPIGRPNAASTVGASK
jgi:hypothetical protein